MCSSTIFTNRNKHDKLCYCSNIYQYTQRRFSYFLLKKYLELNFYALHAATNNRFVDDDDKWLTNLVVIALFSNFKLTTGSGKHLETIDDSHIVSLMYKL